MKFTRQKSSFGKIVSVLSAVVFCMPVFAEEPVSKSNLVESPRLTDRESFDTRKKDFQIESSVDPIVDPCLTVNRSGNDVQLLEPKQEIEPLPKWCD